MESLFLQLQDLADKVLVRYFAMPTISMERNPSTAMSQGTIRFAVVYISSTR